jgi:competence protein ComEC
VFDIGRRILAPFLWQKKIKTVHRLILSHPDSDHLNGFIFIAGHFNVETLWTNGEAAGTIGYHTLMDVIAKKEIDLPRFESIPKVFRVEDVTVTVLYPPVDFAERKANESWRNANNNSMVVKITKGAHSFLFPGDIMKSAERELCAMHGGAVQSTILVAPHHGSKTSSSERFIKAVAPEVVIFSCGRKYRYGFPSSVVLARYKKRRCRMFSTNDHGAVLLSTDGVTLDITTGTGFKPDEGSGG